jgi:hypothetical protein
MLIRFVRGEPWQFRVQLMSGAPCLTLPGFTCSRVSRTNVARLTRENNKTPVPEEGTRLWYGTACDDQPLTESELVIPRKEVEA